MTALPRLIIASTNSGGGKTTVTFGIMKALINRGLQVQGFKCGPDYIDPGHHANVTGRPSHNLDTWMIGRDASYEIFTHYATRSEISIIEGVMGLFDGKGVRIPQVDANEQMCRQPDPGSTADVAMLLSAPVILVLDVRAQGASAAAVVKGFREMVPELNLAGVILNRVGSERHAKIVSEAIGRYTGAPVLGAIPRSDAVSVPERHLGLLTGEEDTDRAYQTAGELIEEYVDIDTLLHIARETAPLSPPETKTVFGSTKKYSCRVAVARDKAFNFLYPANMDMLAARGCEVKYFSPLRDEALPENTDLVYFCGGYPELHAETLAGADKFRNSMTAHISRGGAVYGECGGLMLAGESMLDMLNHPWPMLGLLPLSTNMTGKRLSLGYVEVTALRDSLLAPKGANWRGHEFHYSEVQADPSIEPCWAMRKSYSTEATPDGWQSGRVLAGYLHLHFASCPELLDHLLGAVAEEK